jgi:hypothetical protein
MKCPVPRPILNILMNRRGEPGTSDPAEPAAQTLLITSSEERERQWVATQISVFRDSYGNVPGYDLAEAYLESVLSLATSGRESERVSEVLNGGTYAEPYGRVLSAIRSVGAVLEEAAEGGGGGGAGPRPRARGGRRHRLAVVPDDETTDSQETDRSGFLPLHVG